LSSPEHFHYDEFGLFHENAAEFGIPYERSPVVRRIGTTLPDGRTISALRWGDAPPRFVLIHGGGQNAHTWDTVALALGDPLLAIDLPGHGHSDGPSQSDAASQRSAPTNFAADLSDVIRQHAPEADAIVGMSLGGLTAIALLEIAPALVRRLALVDITPGVTQQKSAAIANFVRGPATFPSLEELLARTIEHNPGRSVSSLRRGILHNAMQLQDGSWMWRYRRFPIDALSAAPSGQPSGSPGPQEAVDPSTSGFGALWDLLESSNAPLMLARGMRPQSVVDNTDCAELLRRRPDCRIVEFPDAGHSVQGDMPVELAETVSEFTQTTGPSAAPSANRSAITPV
jgi:pimeloyl-ACP methyl ester carboxylesterase